MSEIERDEPRFPCHIYDFPDAEEAYDSFRGDRINVNFPSNTYSMTEAPMGLPC